MNELTDEQKDLLRKNFRTTPDLQGLVDLVFGADPKIDPRSKQGRLVSRFLSHEGVKYDVKKTSQSAKVILKEEEKDIINELLAQGKNSLEIAQAVWPKKEIKKLSVEQKVILNYIERYTGELGSSRPKSGKLPQYFPPRSGVYILAQVNNATGENLEQGKLSRGESICIDRLLVNMRNSRFVLMANSFDTIESRNLFEHEFIRLTWKKPDLTADEVNLYMTMCRDIVSLETINRHLQRLNREFDECVDKDDMVVKLSDMIKAKSTELNSTAGRIEGMMKKLQGDRATRLDKQKENSANFIMIVKAWQEEETRKQMIELADLQKKTVADEANRIETMSEFKARVLGMNKDVLI